MSGSYSYVPDEPLERMQRHASTQLQEWQRSLDRDERAMTSSTRMVGHWIGELESIDAELNRRTDRKEQR